MSQPQAFKRFSDEQQRDYERLARLEYGPDLVNESVRRWKSYTEAEQDAIMAEGSAIYSDIAAAIDEGLAPTDPDVQRHLDRWHQHLRYFYEPTLDVLRGLGETYALNPEFRANLGKIHAMLPDYLREGVAHYVNELETKIITQMLAEDDARRRRLQS